MDERFMFLSISAQSPKPNRTGIWTRMAEIPAGPDAVPLRTTGSGDGTQRPNAIPTPRHQVALRPSPLRLLPLHTRGCADRTGFCCVRESRLDVGGGSN
uniref:Uncharacterized protein n=1 Tax=Leersia perrieri TaxID=77586 RepID=A0A0D9VSD1_9ORYZ